MQHKFKQTQVAILTSDKLEFGSKKVTRDKEGYYIGWKFDPTGRHINWFILNWYTLKNKASK